MDQKNDLPYDIDDSFQQKYGISKPGLNWSCRKKRSRILSSSEKIDELDDTNKREGPASDNYYL